MTEQSQHTILIVEDDLRMQKSLQHRLQEDGHNVLVAANVDSGVALVRDHEVNLILLDLRLDEKSGLEFMDEIRNDDSIDDEAIVVVVLTAIADPAMALDVLTRGSRDYLVKSDNSLDDIAAFVGKKLENKS